MSVSYAEASHTTWEPRYELEDTDVDRLYQDLVAEYGQSEQGVDCYIISGNDERSNLGRVVEKQVFDQKFQNDESVMHAEYGQYEDASLFFIVTYNQKPVGVMRIIQDSPAGFKTLNDISAERPADAHPEAPRVDIEQLKEAYGMQDTSKVWDIATIAINRYSRDPENYTSVLLRRVLFMLAHEQGIEHWMSIIEQKEYNNLQAIGTPFEPMPGTGIFEYLGAVYSNALYCHVPDVAPSMIGKEAQITETEHPLRAAFKRRLIDLVIRGSDDLQAMIRTTH